MATEVKGSIVSIIEGNNWSVRFNKETGIVTCSFNNEVDDISLADVDGNLAYCKECDRFFDVRSGCETDIRDDERKVIVEAGRLDFGGVVYDLEPPH